ncbi:MAG: response regulator, partial [Pseudomonadota bacterium]
VIVEDNELNMKLFRDLLTNSNYEVYGINDGIIAYDYIKKVKPNLILMDIQLQRISGYDIISKIKKNICLSQIPIVAVSAFAMKDDQERIMASGCDAYLSKPISIKIFMDLVNKYVANISEDA